MFNKTDVLISTLGHLSEVLKAASNPDNWGWEVSAELQAIEAEEFEATLWARDAARQATYGWDNDGVSGPQWGLRRPYPADRQAKAKARAKARKAVRRR